MTTAHHASTHPVSTASDRKPLIRPAWTPATIGLTVLLFMLHLWPLGLAMIAYVIWGDRLDAFKSDANRATDNIMAKFGGLGRGAATGFGRTGNVAFDDWRETELKRLDEERQRLATMEREFDDYQRELRRAKDQEEFETFLRRRNTVDNDGAGRV